MCVSQEGPVMIEKMSGVNSLPKRIQKIVPPSVNAERAAIREMVKSAKQRGRDITGPDGLLKLSFETAPPANPHINGALVRGTGSLRPRGCPGLSPDQPGSAARILTGDLGMHLRAQ
jgi:hypothetical protein